MKKIVSGKELQDKILESINILCGTVKKTLGPKGNNVLIDHSNYSPFITNDGVTIAQNIESEDETIGTILEIIKEASIKTNEEVGDGTTTTLVLLESIYKQSINFIEKGESPIIIKKELNKTLEKILEKLNKQKRKASKNDLKNIAYVSAGDETLGNIAYQAMEKIKQKEGIVIKEILDNKTSISYLKGYNCETTLASPYLLSDTKLVNYKDVYILLLNTVLTSLESISFLLNDILNNKKPLVIIANNYIENVVEEIVSLVLIEKIPIYLLKIEEYGMHTYDIMKDISCITNAKIIENENYITSNDVGIAQNIQITKENININFKVSSKSNCYLKKLKKESKEIDSDLESNFYEKRITMFYKGTAEIKLGAPTKTEWLEKRMHLEDAICALSVSNKGILPGAGISLLQVSSEIESITSADKIWASALKKPFEQILENSGLNYLEIEKQVEKKNYNSIYNISTERWEEINQTNVVDPFLVIEHSLINATSIAGMLLTTTSLIINEHKNNLNKEDEYNNW